MQHEQNCSIGVRSIVARSRTAGKRVWTTAVYCTGAVLITVRLAKHEWFKRFDWAGLSILSEAEAVSTYSCSLATNLRGWWVRVSACSVALVFRVFRLTTRQCFLGLCKTNSNSHKGGIWWMRGRWWLLNSSKK